MVGNTFFNSKPETRIHSFVEKSLSIASENIRLSRIYHDPDYNSSMPKAIMFAEIEQNKILVLKEEGMSN
ncbi:Hypothetical predicted protein [Octopus vulgaris]|uniref:Uncharacterized protein n=1 Tax=Octopus vulgaris TaxID=6645 RepID=A0AA36AY70_OCTVU|nr:Hypothetical predicted protein [Octopus vulgaris]